MSVVDTVTSGSLLLAAPLAFAAGVLSFLSPCVLPLVPGYLSYMTGLTGAELAGEEEAAAAPEAEVSAEGGGVATKKRSALATAARTNGRVLAGSLLFVLGFSVVFVSYGALFGALGAWLVQYQTTIMRVFGAVTILLGLAFMGLVPWLQRDVRLHNRPSVGLWGAPMLGVLFGLGWTPCIGPTLGAVQGLALTEASALRGALLSLAYCLGLGLPFVLVGLAFRRAMGAVKVIRKHSLLVMRIGGALLVAIGLLLLTGLWDDLTIGLRQWASSWGTAL